MSTGADTSSLFSILFPLVDILFCRDSGAGGFNGSDLFRIELFKCGIHQSGTAGIFHAEIIDIEVIVFGECDPEFSTWVNDMF